MRLTPAHEVRILEGDGMAMTAVAPHIILLSTHEQTLRLPHTSSRIRHALQHTRPSSCPSLMNQEDHQNKIRHLC